MKTIIINYLWIFGLPLLIGIALRILLNRLPKPYLVTAVLGIVTLIAWCIAMFNPISGSELFGLLAIQATMAFAGSLVTGLVLNCLGHH